MRGGAGRSSRRRRARQGLIALLVAAVAAVTPRPQAQADPAGCTSKVMVVVAHQDDDLFFMNPDIQRDVNAGRCIRAVFVTAGDAGKTTAYWQGREAGMKAAYAHMAGKTNSWTDNYVVVGGGAIHRFDLVERPGIELMFVRLPDGEYASTGFASLNKLWTGAITSLTAVDGVNTFTKDGLVTFLRALLDQYTPNIIRTLTGDDSKPLTGQFHHPDHLSVGRLMTAADSTTTFPHVTFIYLDNSISQRPVNVTGDDYRAKEGTLLLYSVNDSEVCDIIFFCAPNQIYQDFLGRRYIEGSRYVGTVTESGTLYEAEAAPSNYASSAFAGATGGQGRELGPDGMYVDFTVTVPSAQVVELRFRHRSPADVTPVRRLILNGVLQTTPVPFVHTPSTWGYANVQVQLQAGANSVRLEKAAFDPGTVILDHLVVETIRVGHTRRQPISATTTPHTRPPAATSGTVSTGRGAAPSAVLTT